MKKPDDPTAGILAKQEDIQKQRDLQTQQLRLNILRRSMGGQSQPAAPAGVGGGTTLG